MDERRSNFVNPFSWASEPANRQKTSFVNIRSAVAKPIAPSVSQTNRGGARKIFNSRHQTTMPLCFWLRQMWFETHGRPPAQECDDRFSDYDTEPVMAFSAT
jgi:hypothetical protein